METTREINLTAVTRAERKAQVVKECKKCSLISHIIYERSENWNKCVCFHILSNSWQRTGRLFETVTQNMRTRPDFSCLLLKTGSGFLGCDERKQFCEGSVCVCVCVFGGV